jgi:hypothetical protein
MVFLQYDAFTQEQLEVFLAVLTDLSRTKLKDQLPDLTNRIFEANKCPTRPPWMFDGKSYVKIVKITPESCTKNLSVQIRKLTELSDKDLDYVRTLCDELYTGVKDTKKELNNQYRMEVKYGTKPSPPGHVPMVTIVGTNGTKVKVTPEEAQKILGSSDLKKKARDVNGNSFTMKQNAICANCNKGYGKNHPFPLVNGKPTGGVCSRCKMVRYCSKECQRGHWKTHKPQCKSNE